VLSWARLGEEGDLFANRADKGRYVKLGAGEREAPRLGREARELRSQSANSACESIPHVPILHKRLIPPLKVRRE